MLQPAAQQARQPGSEALVGIPLEERQEERREERREVEPQLEERQEVEVKLLQGRELRRMSLVVDSERSRSVLAPCWSYPSRQQYHSAVWPSA